MRLKVIRLIFFSLLFLVILRLGYWQIVQHDDLVARAEGQRILIKEVVAPRGSILFSDGSVLAGSQPTFSVFIQPNVIEQTLQKKLDETVKVSDLISPETKKSNSSQIEEYKRGYAKNLAEFFFSEVRDQEFEDKISSASAEVKDEEARRVKFELETFFYDKLKQDLFWVALNKKVNLDQKMRLEKMGLLGMGFDNTSSRFYPEGSSSAHLLGFVSSDAYGVDTGYFGLEGFYNGELRGKKGLLTQEKDALGLPILIGKFLQQEAKDGKTLILNIDRSVQSIVEEKLKKGVEKHRAKGGSVIIMEPQTGKVLAMASIPSYDPGDVLEYPKENFKNPVVADSYEPGSTFKVLVMGAGINEGLIEPDTKCDICAGPVSLGGFTIRTWNNKYNPDSSMTDVIVHSDNTGMVFISRKLGIDKMYEYIEKYGFGDVTGIDLQDESSPPLRVRKEWKEIDLATASFGQGISVSPLQLVTAVSSIANKGNLMKPLMVSEIKDEKGSYKINPQVVRTPISEEAAKKVTEMMVKAVDQGEAQFYKKKEGVLNYKIAGKTGTAQIPVAGHYDPTKTIASFIGFAPADNPKFVMLVRYQEPQSSIFGADTAAPTFFEIAKELFLYYGIAPDEVNP